MDNQGFPRCAKKVNCCRTTSEESLPLQHERYRCERRLCNSEGDVVPSPVSQHVADVDFAQADRGGHNDEARIGLQNNGSTIVEQDSQHHTQQ
jgi:hypothetical protein